MGADRKQTRSESSAGHLHSSVVTLIYSQQGIQLQMIHSPLVFLFRISTSCLNNTKGTEREKCPTIIQFVTLKQCFKNSISLLTLLLLTYCWQFNESWFSYICLIPCSPCCVLPAMNLSLVSKKVRNVRQHALFKMKNYYGNIKARPFKGYSS